MLVLRGTEGELWGGAISLTELCCVGTHGVRELCGGFHTSVGERVSSRLESVMARGPLARICE